MLVQIWDNGLEDNEQIYYITPIIVTITVRYLPHNGRYGKQCFRNPSNQIRVVYYQSGFITSKYQYKPRKQYRVYALG
jgi:hypothetical protein